MLQALAIPSIVVCFLMVRFACLRLRILTIFAPATGATFAGLVTFVLVTRFGFPDLTTLEASPAFWYAVRSFIYVAFGVAVGLAIGIGTAFGLLRFRGTPRPDISIPWARLGVACCICELATLVTACYWVIDSYRVHVAPNLTLNDGQRAFDEMSYFVIVDICFVVFPMILVARGFAYAAAWSFYNQRRREKLADFNNSSSIPNVGVVFLRSFSSGRARRTMVQGRNPFVSWFAPWDTAYFQRWIGETFDEILRPHVERYLGSFLAIADPNSHLPNMGAESTYARDEDWKHVVATMIESSRAVILMEGATNGLHWELRHLKQCANPKHVVLITLPREFHRTKNAWKLFQNLLVHAGFGEIADPGPGAIVGFTPGWEPTRILANAGDCELMARSIAEWTARDNSIPR
jgi:hypothetical protein